MAHVAKRMPTVVVGKIMWEIPGPEPADGGRQRAVIRGMPGPGDSGLYKRISHDRADGFSCNSVGVRRHRGRRSCSRAGAGRR